MQFLRRALARVVPGVAVVVASISFSSLVFAEAPQVGDYAAVYNTDGEGLRLRAGMWSRTLSILPEGAPARVLGVAQDGEGQTWYQVEAVGLDGWVNGSYLTAISAEEAERRSASSRGGARPTVADIALEYVGYPYVWGGTSPARGFDSSGFLYYVFRTAGYPIPRDYWGMLGQGRPVSLNQLQPGDLVFFVNTYMAGLSHGGIFIGNGQFVHAVSEGRGVRIDSVWRDYYINRYYAARRIIE